jgi:hypothetical protein
LSISLADLDAHRARATDRTLIKALSRAYRWQKLLDDGVYGSITEMADKERILPLADDPALASGTRHRRGHPERHAAGHAAACRPRRSVLD